MDHPRDAKRRGRPLVVIATFCVLMALIPAAGWWLHGHTFWSDGGARRLAASEYPVRRVTWMPARPFEAPTTAPTTQPVYDPFLTPDGSQLYFVRGKPGAGGHANIFRCRRVEDRWSAAEAIEAVNLAGYDSLGPHVTADGRFLLFSSNRPGGLGGFDLWAAPRVSEGAAGNWGKPFNLGPSVNSEFDEYNPDPTPDGKRLIFTTNRTASRREQLQAWAGTIRQAASADFDLWIARVDVAAAPGASPSLVYGAAAEIRSLNTPFTEGASCMSPAGDFLYVASNRPGGLGKFDLYRSRVHGGGEVFDPPENLGPAVNSAANDADPTLAYDGFRLAFSSDRDSTHGDYRLYGSDSREVFPERELPRIALPSLRFGYGTLLLSAIATVVLILLLRNTRSRALTTLQRCLILSLLLHAAAAFVGSFITVARGALGGGRPVGEATVAINLNGGGGAEATIATSIRGQFSLQRGDVDAGSAALASSAKIATELATLPRPQARGVSIASDLRPELLRTSAAARVLPLEQMVGRPPPLAAAGGGPVEVPVEVPVLKRISKTAAEPPVAGTDVGTNVGRIEVSAIATAGAGAARSNVPATVPVASIAIAAGPAARGSTPPIEIAKLPASQPSLAPFAVAAAPATDAARVPPRAAPVTAAGGVESMPATTRPAVGVTPEPAGGLRRDIQAVAAPHAISVEANGPAVPITAAVEVAPPKLPGVTSNPAVESPGLAVDAAVGIATAPAGARSARAAPGNPEVVLASERQRSAPAVPRPTTMPSTLLAPSSGVAITAKLSSPPALSAEPLRLAATSAALVAVAPVDGPLGPADLPAPPSVFPRAETVRHQRVQALGGTAASEEAVDRALAYLARQQEQAGRWTFVGDVWPPPGQRPVRPHDAACTGLALLTFLARNHSPAEAGPYREVVTRGLDFLVANQSADGDLRGREELRGAGSERADLYDHAIATLALAEAATMSGDRRYTDAALLGARFIIDCQDPRGGGWRYSPSESGDTSVLGWQVMALHAAERMGFRIPDETRGLAQRYVEHVRSGPRGALGSYRPGQSPTPAMTAELLYARQLLDQPPDADDVREAAVFFAQPYGGQVDLYCWYYGSLSLVQSPDREPWKVWNPAIRDALVSLQHRGERAADDGCWDTNFRWASRGGRVFSTALATLTLEVYYRYETPAGATTPAAGAPRVGDR